METTTQTQTPTATLLEQARAGSPDAWAELTARYEGMLRSVTARCGLPEAQASDVIQTTWMRLLERKVTLRDPEHLGGWLKIVAQRESWRYSAKWRRDDSLPEESVAGALRANEDAADVDPEAVAIRADQCAQLWAAIETLPGRQRQLMRILATDDTASYETVAAQLAMPVGSIGPTRARAMARLRLFLGASRPTSTASTKVNRPKGLSPVLAAVAS